MKRFLYLMPLLISSLSYADFDTVYDTYSGSYVNTDSTTASDYFKNTNKGNYYNTYTTTTQAIKSKKETITNSDGGFFIAPAYKMEWADFKFDMNAAGSIVTWSDMTWNTFGGDLGYNSKTSKFGFSAGYYHGTTDSGTGTDDDLYNGGGLIEVWTNNSFTTTTTIGYASISVGDASGTKDDAYAKFSLNDFWKNDGLSFSPNAGYRYFHHRLKIKDSRSVQVYGDEISVDSTYGPYIDTSNGKDYTAETVYGTTHDYKTTWQGPFIGFDIKNQFTGGGHFVLSAEFGLPSYDSEGYWPNREDLANPGFEDTGKIGDAYHLGLSMNYLGKISDNLFLDLGMEFNYYTLSDGEAKTNYYDGTSYKLKEELNATWKSVSGKAGLKYKF